jgi:hypothetical protein
LHRGSGRRGDGGLWQRGIDEIDHQRAAGGGHQHADDGRHEGQDGAQGQARQAAQAGPARKEDDHYGRYPHDDVRYACSVCPGTDARGDVLPVNWGSQPHAGRRGPHADGLQPD